MATLKGSYSIEWKTITKIDNFRKKLVSILNDNPSWWEYIVIFGQKDDNEGYWKIIKNKKQSLKANDLQKPTYSRRSTYKNLEDVP